MKTKQSFKIRECPQRDDIQNAIKILSDQKMHVYQVLYSAGYTNPNDYPLKVERSLTCVGGISEFIKISLNNRENNNNGLSFDCTGTENDSELLRKAKMLIDGNNKEKIDRSACCCYAKLKGCVCYKAFTCELHGEIHIGSHD